jgi:hypothetical protein
VTEPLPSPPSGTTLLDRADQLASRLVPYQAALGHLLRGTPQDVSNKLRILFFLLSHPHARKDDLLATGTAPLGELQELYRLGLIRARRTGITITDRGTNILTVLLFFDADVQGVFSQGFDSLLSAVLAGSLDADTMARITSSGALRLAEELEDETDSGDLNILDQAVSTRKRSIDQLGSILGKLRNRIDPVVQAELTSSATHLTKAYWTQEHAHNVLWNQDVRYAHGYNHSNIIKRLGQHNIDSLVALMAKSNCNPRRFPSLQRQPSLEGVANLLQRPMTPPASAVEDLVILTPETAPQGLAPHFESLVSDLARAKDGAALHKLAGNATTYFAGVALAILRYHPVRVQVNDVTFQLHDDRIHEPPFVDVPRITIHRR